MTWSLYDKPLSLTKHIFLVLLDSKALQRISNHYFFKEETTELIGNFSQRAILGNRTNRTGFQKFWYIYRDMAITVKNHQIQALQFYGVDY